MNPELGPIILVDQDDTIADFYGEFSEVWRRNYPNSLFVQPDQRRHNTVRGDYPTELHPRIEKIYNTPEFYLNIPPLPGAIEALLKMKALGLDPQICTSPPPEFPHWITEKRKWLDYYLGAGWIMHTALDKTAVEGAILIDDNPKIIGKHRPRWRHVLLDQPYNRDVPKPRIKRDWSNWEEVIAPLIPSVPRIQLSGGNSFWLPGQRFPHR